MTHDAHEHLAETIDQLKDAAKHLAISLKRCSEIESNETEVALIEFEALTSRFARATDILIHKVYRTIDHIEFIDGGTLIDVMNRAEKRGLIDSIHEMRIFKDLRNDIAHEYIAERIQIVHQEVLQQIPKLLELIERAVSYCQKYRYPLS